MGSNAVDIQAAFSTLTPLRDRTPTSSGAAYEAAFETLAETETGGVFAASFYGESAWEVHPNGDEFVQIVSGRTKVTILDGDDENTLDMPAGSFVIVPRGAWHKFYAPEGVQVMTVTPTPTEHWREEGAPPQRLSTSRRDAK